MALMISKYCVFNYTKRILKSALGVGGLNILTSVDKLFLASFVADSVETD